MSWIGMDGRVVRSSEAVVSVMDHGLLYGIGLFETFRTYGGNPFLLEQHLNRMAEGCRWLGIDYVPDKAYICRWIEQLLSANGLTDAYIRLTITAGEGALGLPAENYHNPRELLYVKQLPNLPDTVYQQGRALQLLRTPRNTPETPVRLKSLHFMNNMIAKRELQTYPEAAAHQAEGLLLTDSGELAEGIVSNLFFVKGERLYTPEISTGILPGVTRAFVLELAESLGIPVEEGLYTWKELKQADEVFTTGSIQEIMPITRLLEHGELTHTVGSGLAGPVTSRLIKAYRQKAGNYEHDHL